MHELDDYLEILGQQPSMRGLYTQICFCFRAMDSSQTAEVVRRLTSGLEQVSIGFPWIAGQVVCEPSEIEGQENFKIRPYEHTPVLTVKDLRNDPTAPTFDGLRQADFPMHMLDESIVAPCTTLPGGPGKSLSDPLPVFLIQVTLIHDGLLLTFVGQHNTMDMVGQAQVISLIDKACRNEDFSTEDLQSGNLVRRDIIPLLDNSWLPDPEYARQFSTPPPFESSNRASTPPKCQWAYFVFSSNSLAELKSIATKTISVGYISTDDTLTAFIWQRTLQARSHRLNRSTKVTLARAVNVRRHLGISSIYPGFVQNMTYHSYKLQDLVNEQLGLIASNLRASLDPKTSQLAHDTRALATMLSRAKDKNLISFVASLDVSKDIMLSSWAQIDSYSLHFGLGLGKPESVRRPRFPPVEGLFYLMPKSLDGEIAVAVCLSDEDMNHLKNDAEFARYGRFIG